MYNNFGALAHSDIMFAHAWHDSAVTLKLLTSSLHGLTISSNGVHRMVLDVAQSVQLVCVFADDDDNHST